MWNQNLNEVSKISFFVHANVLTPVGSKYARPLARLPGIAQNDRRATIFVSQSCLPKLYFEISGNKRIPMHFWFQEVLAMKIIQPLSLSSYFSVVVCLRWLYHHVLSVSYMSPKNWVCVFYCCAALWCAHILKYIMARCWYSCVCTSNYLVIIIMQTYLKVLNF